MRDAAIPSFVNSAHGYVGFTGSHQITETHEMEKTSLQSARVISLKDARFVIACRKSEVRRISESLSKKEPLILSTEYKKTGRNIIQRYGYNVSFKDAPKGISEIMAGVDQKISGVLAISSTGTTLAENGLAIVRDTLLGIDVNVVWNEAR
jgi:ATP phosphoribosyltransferase